MTDTTVPLNLASHMIPTSDKSLVTMDLVNKQNNLVYHQNTTEDNITKYKLVSIKHKIW